MGEINNYKPVLLIIFNTKIQNYGKQKNWNYSDCAGSSDTNVRNYSVLQEPTENVCQFDGRLGSNIRIQH